MIGAAGKDLAYRWVRKGNYKLIVPASHGTQLPWNHYVDRPALFDLVQDPAESNDLIGDPSRAQVVAELSEALDRWWSP